MNTNCEECMCHNNYHASLSSCIHCSPEAFIKDQITKAQQEIAEQIIEEIPDETRVFVEGHTFALPLKDQLRIKYIKKRPIS